MAPTSEKSSFATPLAVCGFLLLGVVLVFGQTLRHEFVNLDDKTYVYENSQVAGRIDCRKHTHCLHHHMRRQLASPHYALAYARLPILWAAGMGASLVQFPVARCQRRSCCWWSCGE